MVRTLYTAAMLVLLEGVAHAQITTYVAPPRVDTLKVLAVADSARRDSVAQLAVTNMKAWVDSAAGVDVPSQVGRIDSAALVNDPGRPDVRVTTATTSFSDGAVAPATATRLPTLALLGSVAVVLGLILVFWRPRS